MVFLFKEEEEETRKYWLIRFIVYLVGYEHLCTKLCDYWTGIQEQLIQRQAVGKSPNCNLKKGSRAKCS